MADRKQTPDVLGQILGQAPPAKTVPPTMTDESRPVAPEHPRWEYIEVIFRDYGGMRPRAINGEEIPGWKQQPPIHDYLNHLGDEGWELVGLGHQRHDEMPAYFKRRKR